MKFMQLGLNPGDGIPNSDSYCFGKYFKTHPASDEHLYRFRDHAYSNRNSGGWVVHLANKTSFKLELIRE